METTGQMRQTYETKWSGPNGIEEIISLKANIIEEIKTSSMGSRSRQSKAHIHDLAEFNPRGV